MQNVKEFLTKALPLSFKDARMTLESALASPALGPEQALVAAYAVAVTAQATDLARELKSGLNAERVEQAEVAVGIMGMTNVYYSFLDTADLPDVKGLPAQIRMVSYGQQGTKDKLGFEIASLAVSLVGKCKPCIVAHVDELKKLGFSAEQFRDLGRICGAVNAVAKGLTA